jgi:anti-sigma regulatory factor (Ser/Thr protein kinase)
VRPEKDAAESGQGHAIVDKASLSGIRRRVRAELHDRGAPPSASFDCLVALTETCTDALRHTEASSGDLPPEISWIIDDHEARFFVEDYSQPRASMAAHPSRNAVTRSNDPRMGGFGIDIVRRLMDDVQVSIEPGGTKISLLKKLS